MQNEEKDAEVEAASITEVDSKAGSDSIIESSGEKLASTTASNAGTKSQSGKVVQNNSVQNKNEEEPNKITGDAVKKIGEVISQGTDQGGASEKPPHTAGEKADILSAISQAKQVVERPVGTQQLVVARPPLEENIVLGIALEDSKRTLLIEDEMAVSAESKQLAANRNESGSLAVGKEKKDAQMPAVPLPGANQTDY